jgi:hypothetical protein
MTRKIVKRSTFFILNNKISHQSCINLCYMHDYMYLSAQWKSTDQEVTLYTAGHEFNSHRGHYVCKTKKLMIKPQSVSKF